MDKQQDTRTIEEIQEALSDLMLEHFRPVEKEADATQMLTTEQLLHIVNSHSPDMVPPDKFRECMLALNFVERWDGSRFHWLLTER